MNKVTEEMLHAAVKKASEVGLIQKYADMPTYTKTWKQIESVLRAALEEQSNEPRR